MYLCMYVGMYVCLCIYRYIYNYVTPWPAAWLPGCPHTNIYIRHPCKAWSIQSQRSPAESLLMLLTFSAQHSMVGVSAEKPAILLRRFKKCPHRLDHTTCCLLYLMFVTATAPLKQIMRESFELVVYRCRYVDTQRHVTFRHVDLEAAKGV